VFQLLLDEVFTLQEVTAYNFIQHFTSSDGNWLKGVRGIQLRAFARIEYTFFELTEAEKLLTKCLATGFH
jgi:hypothetical protein